MADYHSEGILDQIIDRDYKIKIDSTFQEELERWRKKNLRSFNDALYHPGVIPTSNPFKPVFSPWWQSDIPATIRDDKVVIHVKKRNIKFNFKD